MNTVLLRGTILSLSEFLKYNICVRCFSIINLSFIIRENESILK